MAQFPPNLEATWPEVGPTGGQFEATWRRLGPLWTQNLNNLKRSLTQLGPIWGHLAPTWSDLAPTWDQLGRILVQLGANLVQLGPICCQHGSTWRQHGVHLEKIGRLWAHLGPFWLKFGATVGPYIHMSILYSPCSTVYVFLGPYSTVHTSIAHRILLHKQTRPQQYQLQSLPAALCESTIASCPLPTVYCISPLPITYCPLPRSAG